MGLVCGPCMWALYVGLVCGPCMWALYVGLVCGHCSHMCSVCVWNRVVHEMCIGSVFLREDLEMIPLSVMVRVVVTLNIFTGLHSR